MNISIKTESRYRQQAKALKKSENISHAKALEKVAHLAGYSNWASLRSACQTLHESQIPLPLASETFLRDEDITSETDFFYIEKRVDDIPLDLKLRVIENQKYLISEGINYSMFEPTPTGLKKYILDATRPVREHFAAEEFHRYVNQSTGKEFKVFKNAYFLSKDQKIKSKVSLYRPSTKKGDPRMWFSNLPSYASSGDQIAIVVFCDELYLFNLSVLELSAGSLGGEIDSFVASYTKDKNSVAEELLELLRIIAREPIRASVVGDTAVGMAVEAALGIMPNSERLPDYKSSIEIKSGRGGKNRTTLFAQVPNWNISSCKSSAEILDMYGYQRETDFKLYCTISTQKVNSQGLSFYYDESSDLLIEKDINDNQVAVWSGTVLRKRLLEKHAETFWIEASSMLIDGVEHFKLVSVTHTQSPIVEQLLPLISAGVVTMDHLIKRKGGLKPRVSEKGPLFKIDKKDLGLLFPKPKTYML